MRIGRKRRIKDYTCWLCGKTLDINVPRGQRETWPTCTCDKEGRKYGGSTQPYGLTEEQISKAIEDYRKVKESLPVAKE